ncbi:ATP phosphoribosyltransferase, partial [Streptomyces sp. DSM 41978]
PLGFARSTFRFAAKPGQAGAIDDLTGKTVATSYEGIVAKHLADSGIDASVVHLDGAVETAIELGVAEVIADVVETGTSLRNAGLEVFGEPIMKSEAIVIRRTGAPADDSAEPKVQQFLRRLQGVLVARTYVMMDYDCRVEQLEKAVALTPGLESPTVSPLHNEGWVAVRAMVPAKEAQRIMDDLYEIGARAILTTAIHACRL